MRVWPPNYTGYYEGEIEYSCDECGKTESFAFEDATGMNDAKAHRKSLREDFGWITTQVNDKWKDFCSAKCRDAYIRKHTS